MSKQSDEIAALKARVAELEAKAKPPEPEKPFVPMTDAEHRDWVHQMQERRMSLASNFHPDDLRAMERACPTSMVKEIALRDARAPTGRPGVIPDSQQPASPRPSAGDGTGWGAAAPIGPPPGLRYVDPSLMRRMLRTAPSASAKTPS
jgi:hypothetical protein